MDVDELGVVEHEHEQRVPADSGRFLGIFMCALGGGTLIAGPSMGAVVGLAGLLNAPSMDVRIAMLILAFGLVAVGAGAGILLLVLGVVKARRARMLDRRIELREGGLVIRTGDEIVAIPWAEAWYWRAPTHKRVYGVQTALPVLQFSVGNDAIRAVISGRPDLRSLGEWVEERVTGASLRASGAILDDGGEVRFGAIAVRPHGIVGFGLGTNVLAWADVEKTRLGKRGTLDVRAKGRWWTGPTYADVPNVEVVETLIDTRGARSAA